MYEEYIELIRQRLKPDRFIHSMNVAECAAGLAEKYGADENKAYLCGIFHDICKNDLREKQLQYIDEFGIILDNVQRDERKLWHAVIGAAYIEHRLGITDREIIDAVRYHTTARADMTLMDKILYIADYISADRDFDGVDALRSAADNGLDEVLYECLKFTVVDLASRGKPVHPDSVAAYNQTVLSKWGKEHINQ